MKKTFRNVLVASVATGLLLTACGSSSDAERQQPKVNTSNLRAPMNNPTFDAGAAAQQGQPQMAVMDVSTPAGQADQYARADMGAQAQPAPQQEKGGMFDWMWKEKQQQPQVSTMERRVPVQNQNPSADFAAAGLGSYEAAAPVAEVEMAGDMNMQAAPQMAPQGDIIVAEEVIMMDDTFTPVEEMAQPQMQAQGDYPSLASVPPRPERIDAINQADARMADLEAARAESYAQNQSLNAQMGADAEGSMLASAEPQMAAPANAPVAVAGQSDLDAEFAALIGADAGALPTSGQPVVVVEEQPAVVVSQDSDMYQEPAPIQMANANVPAQPLNAPMEDTNWQPAPLAPQTQPVQEGEWVSLQQDPQAQMAVPVEQVEVVGTPQVAAVSAVPVVPQDNAVGGIQLTPPSAFGNSVRTLPESRYAARRQAVYMQRYGRMQQAGY